MESEIESRLVQEIKKRGGLCLKFVSPGNAGVPDRIVVYRGAVWFVELKTDTGRVRVQQRRQMDRLESQGANVFLMRGLGGLVRFLRILDGEGGDGV